MTADELNTLRLHANEIMRQLYLAGEREQLSILRQYAERAIEEIDRAALAAANWMKKNMTKTQQRRDKLKRQKNELYERQQGKCYWCGCQMLPFRKGWPKFKKYPKNAATIDHIYSRMTKHRWQPPMGEQRLVVACWECNQKRCSQEMKNTPIEELHKRSGRFPQDALAAAKEV